MESQHPSSAERINVLVVDDSIANLRLLSAVLMEEGITPRPITSGSLAFAMAKADPPDLVLLDIDMPDMNGFEVCASLKADPALAAIPVIFISGSTETSGIVKALSLGGVDYITKPFQVEEVAARVRTHLRILRLQRQVQIQNQSLERQVAERTQELAEAMLRLQELSALKDEFFAMFAHEIRTPANGLLGMCEMIVELCPPSEELDQYRGQYESSKARLLGLIDDTSLLARVSRIHAVEGVLTPLQLVLKEVRATAPEVNFQIQDPELIQSTWIQDENGLVVQSLATALRMAASFSSPNTPLSIRAAHREGRLHWNVPLDRLHHSQSELDDFFRLESTVRSASYAETLGLAPVAAHRILSMLGGEMRLIKLGECHGQLVIELPPAP